MNVARGGNPGGRHGGGSGSGGPGNGKPYKAGEFVDLSGLTEEPIFLDNVSAAEVERFYPPVARAEHFEGAVAVKLIVDDDGSVARVTVVSDPGHGLGAAAAKVARLYRFKPAKVDGRPVATEILFKVHFELN
jgi:protein TonB